MSNLDIAVKGFTTRLENGEFCNDENKALLEIQRLAKLNGVAPRELLATLKVNLGRETIETGFMPEMLRNVSPAKIKHCAIVADKGWRSKGMPLRQTAIAAATQKQIPAVRVLALLEERYGHDAEADTPFLRSRYFVLLRQAISSAWDKYSRPVGATGDYPPAMGNVVNFYIKGTVRPVYSKVPASEVIAGLKLWVGEDCFHRPYPKLQKQPVPFDRFDPMTFAQIRPDWEGERSSPAASVQKNNAPTSVSTPTPAPPQAKTKQQKKQPKRSGKVSVAASLLQAAAAAKNMTPTGAAFTLGTAAARVAGKAAASAAKVAGKAAVEQGVRATTNHKNFKLENTTRWGDKS